MGTAKSRMNKVAPVTVKEESVCSSRGDMHGDFMGPSKKTSFLIRNYTECNSEFSAEDDTLAEVDRILAECENTDKRLNRRTYKMPMLGSKSTGICLAKRHASHEMHSGKHAELQHGVKNYEDNTVIKPTTDIQMNPPKNLFGITNTKSSTAPGSYSMFDAAEEDLMNTIEREFG